MSCVRLGTQCLINAVTVQVEFVRLYDLSEPKDKTTYFYLLEGSNEVSGSGKWTP